MRAVKSVVVVVVVVVILGSIVFAESMQLPIAPILDAVEAHRGRLATYRVDYEIKTLSKPFSDSGKDMFFSGPDDAVERSSKGTYLMDRENSRFKYETDQYGTWNETRKEFEPMPFKVSNDGERHTLFQATEGNYFAAIKDEQNMTQIGCNPRDFFHLTIEFLELAESRHNNILEIQTIDGDMYKVVISEPLEEEDEEFKHEFTLAPMFDWNVITHHIYTKEGKLVSTEKVEYERVNGIPFIKNAYLNRYNPDNPNEMLWSDVLRVDVDSVKVNLPVKDSDFQISLPQGTDVYDHRYDLAYTIGAKESLVRAAMLDPAILFASGKEYDELPQEIQSKVTEGSGDINDIGEELQHGMDEIDGHENDIENNVHIAGGPVVVFSTTLLLIALTFFAHRRGGKK